MVPMVIKIKSSLDSSRAMAAAPPSSCFDRAAATLLIRLCNTARESYNRTPRSSGCASLHPAEPFDALLQCARQHSGVVIHVYEQAAPMGCRCFPAQQVPTNYAPASHGDQLLQHVHVVLGLHRQQLPAGAINFQLSRQAPLQALIDVQRIESDIIDIIEFLQLGLTAAVQELMACEASRGTSLPVLLPAGASCVRRSFTTSTVWIERSACGCSTV